MPVIRTRPAVPVIRTRPVVPPPGLRKRKKPRAGRGTFFQMLRGRGRIRAVRGGEKFFRCCAGAYAPPAGASGSVTSPIFSMRSSLTAVRPLRSA